jgi:TolB-like protein/DNA-binding winged helix-turn-helix (wHTH) protein
MQATAHAGDGPGRASALGFGPFELDLRAGELRKAGCRIRLQEQPFQILRMLLESPGEVVLREEIRSRLWPDNTIVEFEHSINAAVKRLRDALCDSAGKPLYIETMARRGYRFIGQLNPKAAGPGMALIPSIAVLPFADLSGDRENEYFSDGLAEEIIANLSRGPGLKVIARTSAFAFKGKQEDIRKIGQALGVTNVLEGSVRRAGSRVRVIAQLIAAADGSHLWSERYDREMADIFAIQDEIAQAISSALQVQLSGISRPHTPQLPAYEAYLKARHCMASFTRESLASSRQFFERAIALDPSFAEAYSGLAMSILWLVFPGLSPAHESMPLARTAAESALELDPASQAAHGVLGMVAAIYEFDWKEAERRFKMAMTREPVPAYVRWYCATYLLLAGRVQESADQCLRGLKDDPLNFIGRFHYAAALLGAGNDDAGEAELRELCALHPNLYQSFYLLSLSQSLRGLHAEALATAENAYTLAPWNTGTTGVFAGALMRAGERRRAEELLQDLLPGDGYGTPLGLLVYSVMCSEIEQAANWAWKVLEQRDPRLIFIVMLMRSPSRSLLRSSGGWPALAARLDIPLSI